MQHKTDPFSEANKAMRQMEARRAAQVSTPFDPAELVQLATEQWPEQPLVAAAFALCTAEWPESELYTHFIPYADRLRFHCNGGDRLQHPSLGELVVDFAKDDRVAGGIRVYGIEYMDRVMGVLEQDEQGRWLPRKSKPAKLHVVGKSTRKGNRPQVQVADIDEGGKRNAYQNPFTPRGSAIFHDETVLRGADDEMDATDQEEVVVDLFSAHEMYEKNYLAWYTRKNDRVGTPFDPSALVRLAAEQWSGMPKVAASFALCTAEWPRSKLYTNFLCDADRAASRYAGGSILEDPNLGVLVVDFAYDPQVPGGVRVSGMEYLDRVLGHSGVGTIRWMREMEQAKSAERKAADQKARCAFGGPGKHLRIVRKA